MNLMYWSAEGHSFNSQWKNLEVLFFPRVWIGSHVITSCKRWSVPRLFRRWIMLSTGEKAIQLIAQFVQLKLNRMVTYHLLERIIHPLTTGPWALQLLTRRTGYMYKSCGVGQYTWLPHCLNPSTSVKGYHKTVKLWQVCCMMLVGNLPWTCIPNGIYKNPYS